MIGTRHISFQTVTNTASHNLASRKDYYGRGRSATLWISRGKIAGAYHSYVGHIFLQHILRSNDMFDNDRCQGTSSWDYGICNHALLGLFMSLTTNHNMQNDQYWAITEITQRQKLLKFICPGLMYHISNFRVVAAPTAWKPIDTDKLLIFGKQAEIHDCLDDNSIPRYKFNLCTWSTVMSRVGNKDNLTGLVYLFFTSVNCCINCPSPMNHH